MRLLFSWERAESWPMQGMQTHGYHFGLSGRWRGEVMTLPMTGAYAPEATCKHGVHPYQCTQGCDPNMLDHPCPLCGHRFGDHKAIIGWMGKGCPTDSGEGKHG